MSQQSCVIFPIRKRNCKRKNNVIKNKENDILVDKISLERDRDLENTIGPVRKLFESPSKKGRICCVRENSNSHGQVNNLLSTSPITVSLHKQDSSPLANAKQVFHVSMPSQLVGRDVEVSKISNFLSDHFDNKKPGSLYISGAPGTGKTSCLMHILNSSESKFQSIFINCMSVNNSYTVFKKIALNLGLPSNLSQSNITKKIEEHLKISDHMIVLVLDEIDQLDSKGQDILYCLFEWPQLPQSSLILVGIANALDLTDRVLPRLHTFKYQPDLLHFQPYSKEQIVAILEDRLAKVSNNEKNPIIKPAAIQLCARKVAACTGDIRKALEVCRRAVEIVENETRRQLVFQHTSDDRCNPGSPKKYTLPSITKGVDLQQINFVLEHIYGSRMQSSGTSNSTSITLPLQQKILLCTLFLVIKNCKPSQFTLGHLYEVYRRVCKKRQMGDVDQGEFHGLCSLIEARGLIELKKNKIAKMTKFILKVDENEIQHVLQDKTLLSTILSDKSVVQRF